MSDREVLFVRTSKENKAWVNKRAKQLGLSASDYMHKVILKLKKTKKAKRNDDVSIFPEFR